MKNKSSSVSKIIPLVIGAVFISNFVSSSNIISSYSMPFIPTSGIIFVLAGLFIGYLKKSNGPGNGSRIDFGDSNSTVESSYCKNCGKEVAADSPYCQYCGTSTTDKVECDYCGHMNPKDAKSCSQCNATLF